MRKKSSELFQQLYEDILRIVERRRSSWELTSVIEWQDVSSMIMAHIWNEFDKYDPSRPLDRWVNKVTTNRLKNLSRQHLYKHARPCIAASSYGDACAFNRGGNTCEATPSGLQCSECKLYARWQAKKELKFNVSTPLSLENHINESNNRIHDNLDILGAKNVIDSKILSKLNPEESKLYRYLYIKHMKPETVGKKMGYKLQKNSKIPGYLIIRKFQIKVVELAREIIDTEGLA